jgi:hypothetical protein
MLKSIKILEAMEKIGGRSEQRNKIRKGKLHEEKKKRQGKERSKQRTKKEKREK